MLPTSRLRLIFLTLGLLLLAAGCATAPYTGRRQLLFTSEGSETRMGYQAFQKLKQHYKIDHNPEVNALVSRVGRRIAAAAQRPDYKWELWSLRIRRPTPSACPGASWASLPAS